MNSSVVVDSFRSAEYGSDVSKTLSHRAAGRLRAVLGEMQVRNSELARRLGVSEPWVWRRVHGITSLSMADIESIASVLDISPSALLPTPTEAAA